MKNAAVSKVNQNFFCYVLPVGWLVLKEYSYSPVQSIEEDRMSFPRLAPDHFIEINCSSNSLWSLSNPTPLASHFDSLLVTCNNVNDKQNNLSAH